MQAHPVVSWFDAGLREWAGAAPHGGGAGGRRALARTASATRGAELVPEGVHRANIWQGRFPFENALADGHGVAAPVGYAPNALGSTT